MIKTPARSLTIIGLVAHLVGFFMFLNDKNIPQSCQNRDNSSTNHENSVQQPPWDAFCRPDGILRDAALLLDRFVDSKEC